MREQVCRGQVHQRRHCNPAHAGQDDRTSPQEVQLPKGCHCRRPDVRTLVPAVP